MSPSPVVTRVALAEDEIVGSEKSSKRTRMNTIHSTKLEIIENSSQNVVSSRRLLSTLHSGLRPVSPTLDWNCSVNITWVPNSCSWTKQLPRLLGIGKGHYSEHISTDSMANIYIYAYSLRGWMYMYANICSKIHFKYEHMNFYFLISFSIRNFIINLKSRLSPIQLIDA